LHWFAVCCVVSHEYINTKKKTQNTHTHTHTHTHTNTHTHTHTHTHEYRDGTKSTGVAHKMLTQKKTAALCQKFDAVYHDSAPSFSFGLSLSHPTLTYTPLCTCKKKQRSIQNMMPSTTILLTLSLSGFLDHTHPTLTHTQLHTRKKKGACYQKCDAVYHNTAHSLSFGFPLSHTPHSHIHPTPHYKSKGAR